MTRPDVITNRYNAALAETVYRLRPEISLDGEGGLPTRGRLLTTLVEAVVTQMISDEEAPLPGPEDEIILKSRGRVLIGQPVNRGWNRLKFRNS